MTNDDPDGQGLSEVEYVRRTVGQLWPDHHITLRTRPALRSPRRSRDLVVLPSLRRPRLIVPLDRTTAAAAVVGFKTSASGAARRRMVAAATAVRCGALRLVPSVLRLTGDERIASCGIDQYLSQALGTPVRVSMHLGPPRAVRKPVLQLFSPTGALLGFAKVGTTDLTRGLVAAETERLLGLDREALHCVVVPEVLHHGSWRGLSVLVQSPLVPATRTPVPPSLVRRAMLEVAGVAGVSTGSLGEHPYLDRLRRTSDTLPVDRTTSMLRAALDETAEAARVVLRFGAWHGDWTPWNMASDADRLLVWDWEHFESGVPVGFDVLHHHVVKGARNGTAPEAVFARLRSEAAGLLTEFQPGPHEARLVARLYVLDIATRYLRDGEDAGDTRLGNVARWLAPALRPEPGPHSGSAARGRARS